MGASSIPPHQPAVLFWSRRVGVHDKILLAGATGENSRDPCKEAIAFILCDGAPGEAQTGNLFSCKPFIVFSLCDLFFLARVQLPTG